MRHSDDHNQHREQMVLGNLLSNARKQKGFSRAKLAKLTGVGVNSIVRYEKAGIDPEDGQYPPAPKLAMLCLFLNIPPSEAFWSCLPKSDYDEVYDEIEFVIDHPAYNYVYEHYLTLLKDNHLLRQGLLLLLGMKEGMPASQVERDWYYKELKRLVNRHKDFESRLMQWGCIQLVPTGWVAMGEDDPNSWVLHPSKAGQISQKSELPSLILVALARRQMELTLENIDRVYPEAKELSRQDHFNKMAWDDLKKTFDRSVESQRNG